MNAPSFRLERHDALIIDDHRMRVIDRDRHGLTLKGGDDAPTQFYANDELLELYFQRRLNIERAGEGALSPERRDTLTRAYESFDPRWIEEMLRRHEYVLACDRYFTRLKGNPNFAQRPESGYRRVAAIVARYRALRARSEAGPRGKTSGQRERFVAGATLRSWRRQWIAADRNLLALMPMHHRKGPKGPTTITGRVAQAIESKVRELWLSLERPSVSLVYDAIRRRLAHERKTGLLDPHEPDPSKMTVHRWIKANIGAYERVAAREGHKAADAKVRASRPGPEIGVPLRVVEIDHTKLDIFLVDSVDAMRGRGKKAETKPRRPWLTTAIDAATRMIVGFHLSDEAPSWTSVMMTLRMAILPKDLSDIKAASPWPVVGVPEICKLDNGREFHSTSLHAAAAQLKMELRFCRPGSPHLKGKIERFFGEVARDFCTIPGRSFANTAAKGDYRAEYHARMTLEQARKLFKLWVVDVYHNNRHSGLMGKTPLQRWDELSGFGVRLPPTAEELVALIGLVVPRQIRRTGVQYLGLRYNSPEVDALRLAPLSDRGNKWSIKIDPEDLTCVYVLDKLNGRWLVAPCLRPHWVKGLNIRMWKQTCERARAMAPAKEKVRLATLLGARDFILKQAKNMGARPSVVLSPDERSLFGAERDPPIFAVARQAARGRPAKAQPAKTKAAKTKRGKGAPISESAGMDLGKPHHSAKAHVAQAAKAIFEAATDAPAASAPPTDPAGPDGQQAAAAPRASRKRVPKAQPWAKN